ncbi:MAG: Plasmid stabilization system [Parcubacteria group bacterium]|nr:Plasmid stabilization system [Parcubacteria group bacterium]
MKVSYAPQFKRQFKKLPKALQEEVFQKIELFRNIKQHSLLKVHKLKGKLQGRLSFSVNYRFRIIFIWETQDQSAIFLSIGDHSVYDM